MSCTVNTLCIVTQCVTHMSARYNITHGLRPGRPESSRSKSAYVVAARSSSGALGTVIDDSCRCPALQISASLADPSRTHPPHMWHSCGSTEINTLLVEINWRRCKAPEKYVRHVILMHGGV